MPDLDKDTIRDFVKQFRIEPGTRVTLPRDFDPAATPGLSSEDSEGLLAQGIELLSEYQERLAAQDTQSLLVIIQAIDAAGKDGTIRHVMSGVNPQGVSVSSFKVPSPEEMDHDFLWRYSKALPGRGMIGIFNRSYYEEVLIVRVHPEILRAQGLPEDLLDEKSIWKERFRSIVDLENHLHRNGTRILKFYLHLSQEEQRKRFLERIDTPAKNWKFNQGDLEERLLWKEYTKAYESCLSATSTKNAPWYIVPADDKANARLIISRVIIDMLLNLKMSYPEPTKEHRKELLSIRKQLVK